MTLNAYTLSHLVNLAQHVRSCHHKAGVELEARDEITLLRKLSHTKGVTELCTFLTQKMQAPSEENGVLQKAELFSPRDSAKV